MRCKKGGFVFIRQNDLRDLTANMSSKVCKDVEIEQKLTSLTGEVLGSRMKQDLTSEQVEFGNEDNKHF